MVPIKTGGRAGGVQINAADHFLKNGQGHAQQRAHLEAHQALDSAQASAAGHIRSQYRDSLVHHLAGDRAADAHRLSPLSARMDEQRRKLLVAIAIQQNCTALGRHHFKNQFQDLRLQLIQVGNGVHNAADFQQRVEVSSQPRSCRQFFQNSFRLKIENILRTDLRGGLGQASSNSTASMRRFDPVFSLSRNTKTDSPTEIWSPWFNRFSDTTPSVYEGAIAALEIAKRVTICFAAEHAVAPGQGKIADGQRVGGISSDPDFGFGQEIVESANGPAATWSLGFTGFIPRLRLSVYHTFRAFGIPVPSCSTIRTDRLYPVG